MSKSLKIDAELHRKAKSKAALKGITLQRFIELAIRNACRRRSRESNNAGLAESGPAVLTR